MARLKSLGSAALEVVALVGGAGLLAMALNTGSAGPAGCVAWSTEARMDAYGYDHFVHLESKCQATAECRITTSTNPDTISASVNAGEKERVLIWRGSPAREFTAQVTCATK